MSGKDLDAFRQQWLSELTHSGAVTQNTQQQQQSASAGLSSYDRRKEHEATERSSKAASASAPPQAAAGSLADEFAAEFSDDSADEEPDDHDMSRQHQDVNVDQTTAPQRSLYEITLNAAPLTKRPKYNPTPLRGFFEHISSDPKKAPLSSFSTSKPMSSAALQSRQASTTSSSKASSTLASKTGSSSRKKRPALTFEQKRDALLAGIRRRQTQPLEPSSSSSSSAATTTTTSSSAAQEGRATAAAQPHHPSASDCVDAEPSQSSRGSSSLEKSESAQLGCSRSRRRSRKLLRRLIDDLNEVDETHYFEEEVPVEVARLVFSYLPYRTLCVCAQVCRVWRHLAYNDALWLPHAIRERLVRPSLAHLKQPWYHIFVRRYKAREERRLRWQELKATFDDMYEHCRRHQTLCCTQLHTLLVTDREHEELEGVAEQRSYGEWMAGYHDGAIRVFGLGLENWRPAASRHYFTGTMVARPPDRYRRGNMTVTSLAQNDAFAVAGLANGMIHAYRKDRASQSARHVACSTVGHERGPAHINLEVRALSASTVPLKAVIDTDSEEHVRGPTRTHGDTASGLDREPAAPSSLQHDEASSGKHTQGTAIGRTPSPPSPARAADDTTLLLVASISMELVGLAMMPSGELETRWRLPQLDRVTHIKALDTAAGLTKGMSHPASSTGTGPRDASDGGLGSCKSAASEGSGLALFATRSSNSVHIVDGLTGSCCAVLHSRELNQSVGCWHINASHVCFSVNDVVQLQAYPTIRLHPMSALEKQLVIRLPHIRPPSCVGSTYNNANELLVGADFRGVSIFDIRTSKLAATVRTPGGRLAAVAASQYHVAAASFQPDDYDVNVVELYDRRTNKCLWNVRNDPRLRVNSIHMTDERLLFSSADETNDLDKFESGQAMLETHSGVMRSLDFAAPFSELESASCPFSSKYHGLYGWNYNIELETPYDNVNPDRFG